ncbi:MAG: hypothetical protein ACP5RH_02005 [Leptodesmis sp.]|uniref:hypothetical protein n=1 Tax=Leptodesmis sp. TaxID=3100501 RepID=UPI003D10CC19
MKGPEESFVVAPLVDAHSDSQGSSHVLPLDHLSRFEGKVPAQGIWLNLSGRRQWGNDTIAYGQIIHYYPKHHHLAVNQPGGIASTETATTQKTMDSSSAGSDGCRSLARPGNKSTG